MSMMLRSLKNRVHFDRVFREGRFAVQDDLVCYCLRNNGDDTRVGFSLSARVGNAVERNRLRRWLREILRAHACNLDAGWDVVFFVRRPVDLSFIEFKEQVLFLLANREVLKVEA